MRLQVQLAREGWEAIWPEVNELATLHAGEVERGVEPRRRFKIDAARMQQASDAGVLRIYTARRGSKLVGYLTWQVMLDVESEGLLIAQQGAWYVAPGNPKVALELFEYSLASLKLAGVQCCFPHHRTQGRGAGLGKFFARWGAKRIQETYLLWIGD